jgi:cell shape-determining protein MreC
MLRHATSRQYDAATPANQEVERSMDEAKTKEQLIAEVRSLRQRLAEVEALQQEHDRLEQILNSQPTILDADDQSHRPAAVSRA